MKQIPFAKPAIGPQEIAAATRILKSGWLTMGQETIAFEEEFARYVGAKHAVAVNSCTAAMFLSLKALGIGPGDEVIVPSFTFAATANVVVHCGATPVFVDVNPQTFTIDSRQAQRAITAKTKAIIPVHYGGVPSDTNFPVTVVEDSAHRIAKNYRSKNIVCYSFYATKNITTGEGGMITTEDNSQAHWLSQARLHGLSHDAWKRYDPAGSWYYDIEFSGYKANTIDLLAAIGRVQLSRLDELEKKRQAVVARYNKNLGYQNTGTHLYPILVERRNEFMAHMKEAGIACSFHFLPLHKSPAFAAFNKLSLPVTEYIGYRVVTLPLFPALTLTEVDHICGLVTKFGKFSEGQFGLRMLI